MKKDIPIFIILIFFYLNLPANTAPEVSNVRAMQREDDSYLVDVYYDVFDADGDELIISLEVSEDDGSTWDLSCDLVEGDIGSGISSGTDKHIIWNVLTEHPDMEDDDFRFKVIADDGAVPVLDTDWCTILAGDYTWGEYDTIKTINYDYEIMKYEVTTEQYLAYLEEAYALGEIRISSYKIKGDYGVDEFNPVGDSVLFFLGTPTFGNFARIDWNDSTFIITVPAGYTVDDFIDHPVTYVTWWGAWAFAEHYGLRLPSTQEWEKAARGMSGYDYPWGNTISGDRANYRESGDPWDDGTTPVGYYNGTNGTIDSPSPYGCYDMSGNIYEWTQSVELGYNDLYIIRGGYWGFRHYWNDLCSWTEESAWPYNCSRDSGFRCAWPPCSPVTDIDGNEYQTIQIGDQCWMVENLKVTHYLNGDPIPHLSGGTEWMDTGNGAYCVYNNNPTNSETYGNLYNWNAVNDPRGLAPVGWHIPTDEEIMELEIYLGMNEGEANEWSWRGTNEGSMLAGRAELWDNGELENDPEFDDIGFSLFPGGYRDHNDGDYSSLGISGNFWSSSEYDDSISVSRGLHYNLTDILRDAINKRYGLSVRCIRD